MTRNAILQNHMSQKLLSDCAGARRQRKTNTKSKNLSRNAHRGALYHQTVNIQSSGITLGTYKVANEEFPILSFDQDLSSCLNVTAMDTEMDSQLLFYDMPHCGSAVKTTEQSIKHQGLSSLLFNGDSPFVDLADLDPSFEATHSIQDLIDHQDGQLFPDLLSVSPHQQETETPISQVDDSVPPEQPMPESSNSFQASDDQGTEVIIIKPEDFAALGLSLGPESITIEGASGNENEISLQDLIDSSNIQSESIFSSDCCPKTSHKNTLKAEAPSKSTTRKSRGHDKSSEEYVQRRQRNNVAVRKSRDKAKHRQQETESRVKILADENDNLQKKVDLLTKELTVLKGLFINVGASVPPRLAMLLK